MPESPPQPSENPALVAAIAAFSRDQSRPYRDQLFAALASAQYLVPILESDVVFRPGTPKGEHVIEPGSRFQTLICHDPETHAELLPIFSDWHEVTQFTDKRCSTLVLSLAEVRGLLAEQPQYAGAVVNPGGSAGIPLSHALIAKLCGQG